MTPPSPAAHRRAARPAPPHAARPAPPRAARPAPPHAAQPAVVRTGLRARGSRLRTALGALGALGLALVGLAAPTGPTAQAAQDGSGLVISEVYTRGGSAGAAYQVKYVELTNPTTAGLSLDGLSLQYVPARGGTASGTCALSGTVPAGGTYLVTGGNNGSTGAALTGDRSCPAINMSASAGTVGLVQGTSAHTFTVGSTVGEAGVVDVVGYGSAGTYETAPATAPSLTASLQRDAAATDTDVNSADLAVGAPTPRAAGTTPEPSPTPSASSVPTAQPTTSPTVQPTTGPTAQPTDPAQPALTPIAQVQGTGDASPLAGTTVTTRGVVTAVYDASGLNGYYIQTPGSGTAKAPGEASDGVFVYDPTRTASLSPGACLDVTGRVTEYNGLTEITSVSAVALAAEPCAAVTAVAIDESTFPATDAAKEAYEGMLLAPAGAWTVTDIYSTNQYGQVGLAVGDEPLYQATDVVAPGAEAAAYELANTQRAITLDDGSSWNYASMSNTTATSTPLPYLLPGNPLRAGTAVTFTKPVVLDYRYGWNLQPTRQVTGSGAGLDATPITWTSTRQAAPEVGGTVSVASFNVLNYFTDLGQDEAGCSAYTDRSGTAVTARGCTVRGAYTTTAFEHQQAKIVAAVNELDASVVGLEEIENSAKFGHDRDASLAQLVSALNAAAGEERWAYVASPEDRPALADEDLIRTAFIYQVGVVEPVGASVILDDPAYTGTARQPLAQAFKPVGAPDSSQVVVITNHFKSKGSVLPGAGNADSGDGQGANNAQRVLQAKALVGFAAQWDEAGLPVVILGDLNSYSREDPVTTIEAAGYTLIDDVPAAGDVGYSYQYSGRIGSLDHVLLNDAAVALVTGGHVWDVNADESVAWEYSRENYNVTQFYAPDPYRASDHDPVKVGLALDTAPAPEPEPVKPACVERVAAGQGITGTVLLGDWDGDGVASWAVRVGTRVVFYDVNAVDAPVAASISIGRSSDEVFVGDWDGNGTDTLALRRGTRVLAQTAAASRSTVRLTVEGITRDAVLAVSPGTGAGGADELVVATP